MSCVSPQRPHALSVRFASVVLSCSAHTIIYGLCFNFPPPLAFSAHEGVYPQAPPRRGACAGALRAGLRAPLGCEERQPGAVRHEAPCAARRRAHCRRRALRGAVRC
eukprot:14916934-Heterocapsa_arctica.AAC.1